MNSNLLNKLCLTLCLMLLSAGAWAQEKISVKGHIEDEQGEPIIGASVMEVLTTNGTVSDLDGNFVLQVKDEKSTLKISYVGFISQSIRVGSQRNINVVLKEDNKSLSEVVVVGYGHQKKESVVGAISQVSSKDLLSTPAANVTQAIAGKIPGVITTQTSGAPGMDDATINIRGRATFAGDATPLVMVDGVEREFSQIAPDDIESISVLKDASATAVYGVRGANGVILVTTKRGKDQKPEVSLTANFEFSKPTRTPHYLNSYESVQLLNEALTNDGMPAQYTDEEVEMYRKSCNGELTGAEAMLYPNVDWYDEVIKDVAPAQRYNVSVRGGTKRMRYYTSLEYYNQHSLIKNLSQDEYDNTSSPGYRRYAFRANMDFFMTKDLTLSVNFGTRFEDRYGSNTTESASNYDIFGRINHTPGWLFPVSYEVENGSETKTLYGGTSEYQNNVVAALAKGGYYKGTNVISETNFVADYKMDWLTPGLSARAMASYDYDSYYRKLFSADYAVYQLTDPSNYQSEDAYTNVTGRNDTELSYSKSSSTTYKLYMEFQLNYARKFGKHDVTAMVLYNQNDYHYQAELRKRYQGLVGRVTYAYDDKYLAEFNAGYNGSENFRSGKRFGFFPAFALGWRITQEKFMKGTQNWLNNLKLRASYGEVGNDVYTVNGVAQRWLYEEQWSQISNDYYFGTTGKTGIYESQYPNYNVTWERAHKFDLGLEFGLWNGMLNGNLDFFYEKRNDILTSYLTRPEWVGVNMAAGNLGETKNQGYEIELHHNNHIGQDFMYNVGLSFSHAHNEILDMDEPSAKTDYRKQEGHPIGQYFGLVCEGFVTQEDIDGGQLPVSTYTDNVQVGDLKYKDMNNDGFIDDRDETFIGYSNLPENTYSITLGATYKGWGFNVMFQGVDHVSRYYDSDAMFAFANSSSYSGVGKVKDIHLKRWNPSMSEEYNLANAEYPLLHYGSNGDHNQRQNSFFLKNGAYCRLKNIELSYTFPVEWIRHLGMSSCRLYINANNLITWDHLDDLVDPESNGSNRYPIMKTFNMGLNVVF
jgi:TonB-linked SusC/RagA family outer membrane protein